MTVQAWYFCRKSKVGDTPAMRDGSIVPIGEWLPPVQGELELCVRGYHASERAFDALKFASSPWVSRVELRGDILRGDDKLCARERRHLWAADATEVLREFARLCALDVIHLWDAPDVVTRHLETGDESIRAAARNAAGAAVMNATRAAVMNATREAAWNATREATKEAAWNATRDAQGERLKKMLLGLAPGGDR